MRKGLWIMGFLALAAWASAQDAPDAERRTIKVLQNPYDLASFYRSGDSGRSASATGSVYDQAARRYPIASFYRAHEPQGYSRFWSLGYGRSAARVSPYSRTIGRNGDLFLFAPTFLAPVGPLTGAFFEAP